MILADKIIKLRKKNGWSQEELADKMNVSRQAVSKWESAQTVPDLEKILQLGTLFGVTTDYLLKDEIEDEEFTDDSLDTTVKRVTMEEANTFLEQRKRASWQIAVATFLCILSPITLIILGGAAETQNFGVSETVRDSIGFIVLFAFILVAVPMYLYCGFKNEPFEFLDKNVPFELEYGVKGLVTQRKKDFRNTYVKWNIIATCICVFAPVPLLVSAASKNEMLTILMLALTMFLAGVGVAMFIVVGVQNTSMQKLLKEGEFSEKEKTRSKIKGAVGAAYWCLLTAAYLILSFLTNRWDITWLIFAVGGILFPVVMSICNYISDKNNQK